MSVVRSVAVVSALFAASGCQSLDQAAGTWDKANLCVDALQAADFTPNLNDPAQTAQEAAEASQKLSDLAGKAQDVTLRDALNAMSTQVAALNTADLTVDNMQTYIDQKVDLYQTLSSACQ